MEKNVEKGEIRIEELEKKVREIEEQRDLGEEEGKKMKEEIESLN